MSDNAHTVNGESSLERLDDVRFMTFPPKKDREEEKVYAVGGFGKRGITNQLGIKIDLRLFYEVVGVDDEGNLLGREICPVEERDLRDRLATYAGEQPIIDRVMKINEGLSTVIDIPYSFLGTASTRKDRDFELSPEQAIEMVKE